MNSHNNGAEQLGRLALDFADKVLADRVVKPKDLDKVLDTI